MRKATSAALAALAAAAVVGAAEAKDGDPERTGPNLEHHVEMDDFEFRPARLVVRPGQLVVWKNSDRAPHNAVSLAANARGPLFMTRTGRKHARLAARAPLRPGTYRYLCAVHPDMRGTLFVRRR